MKIKLLIVTCMALSALTAFSQAKAVAYKDGAQELSGICVKPTKPLANKAGILILPAWMGIDQHAKDSANQLAELGYYTFIADIYGVGNTPNGWEEAGQKAGYYKKNYKEYQTRIQLALEQLIKQGANADEIVVIGYCFGGTGAIEVARANMNVKGVVSFHGGLARDLTRDIMIVNPKVLVLHGADDPYVSKPEIDTFQSEMRAAHADWQMIYYANAVHAFTDKYAGDDNKKGAAYNEKADKRSWQAMLDFLKEVL